MRIFANVGLAAGLGLGLCVIAPVGFRGTIQVQAATPTPGPSAVPSSTPSAVQPSPADLGALLLAPAGAGLTQLKSQPLTDQDIANENNKPTVKVQLDLEGFTRGYEKDWSQQSAGIVWVEQIQVFRSASGASSHLSFSKQADTSSSLYKSGFPVGAPIQNGYGVHMVAGEDAPPT